ncbi:MAG: alpha/beta hydrolase [Clostridia bacterium]|nr:alpha/beta hydrolase [Clostridia bacterium]
MGNKPFFLNDISYGNHERQKVDIFIPKNVKSDFGIILFIHGGGWHSGDKSVHHGDAQHFCNLGYICATMNYRFVSDDINVFDELDDITSALKIIKDKCAQYGFNIEKLILSGGSAGGHLSLLYAYTRKKEAPIIPVAACVYCPPVNCNAPDFLLGIKGEFEDWKYEILSKCCGFQINKVDFFNKEQQTALKKISPEEYVSEISVPTAVFHGKFDELVPLEHIHNFVRKLNEAGIKNNLLIYENSDHALDKDHDTALQAKNIINDYAQMYF